MSFSKAKIQRFNEVQDDTPAPTTYNVNVKQQILGATISQTERFIKASPATSEASAHSNAAFKTPSLIRKKKIVDSSCRLKIAEASQKLTATKLFSSEHSEALQEKIVECNNKDEYIKDLIDQLDEMKAQLDELRQSLEMGEERNRKLMQDLQNQHNIKLASFTEEISAVNEKHAALNHEYINFKNLELNNFEKKILQMEENYKEALLLAEMQTAEKCKDIKASWKLKLESEECEKMQLAKQLLELEKKQNLSSNHNNLLVHCEQLQGQLCNVELQSIVIKYNEERQKIKMQYEITISKTHETIEALKKRLINSDRDVEQLKSEIEAVEAQKLQMENDFKIVNDNLDLLKEENENLTQDFQVELQTVHRNFNEKIEAYKCESRRMIDDVLLQLHQQHRAVDKAEELISSARMEIERLECENKDLALKFEQSKEQMEVKEIELSQQKITSEDSLVQHNLIQALTNELEGLRLNNAVLTEKIHQQDQLIGPFRKQLEEYEMERHAGNEVKEMALKYADSLGHQNQKQKIKHLRDVKGKNLTLTKSNEDLEKKVRSLTNTVETLKQDSLVSSGKTRKPKKANKENMDSPNCVASSNSIDSPGGPLKERN